MDMATMEMDIEIDAETAVAKARTMRAVVRERFGSPDVLELQEVEVPELADDGVLVRVRAAALNKLDWYDLTGTPWLVRPLTGLRGPKSRIPGHDFAGTVEAVGAGVDGLEPGDEVFGARVGALAELVCARQAVALKPRNLTFEEAAAVPIAGVTALQGLRDHGRLQPGQSVLVNGASGGVGTFAVQIAKALGAEVTAVCSTRNVAQSSALGADHVIDYTQEDFTRGDQRYDLILDVAGGKTWGQYRRVMAPHGSLVIVGAHGSRLTGPLTHIARVRVAAVRGSQRAVFFVANLERAGLDTLRALIEDGHVTPVVERLYDLDEAADAFRYMGEGHARGKLVVTL